MLDYGLSEGVVTSLVALKDSHHQPEHIVLGLRFLHLVDDAHSCLDVASDLLTGEPVHEDDPLVEQVFFRLELDLYGLKHLNRLNYGREAVFSEG